MTGPARGVPFDRTEVSERAYFERFGNGLVVVQPARPPGGPGSPGGPPSGGAWIHLGEDGRARAFSGKVDLGQGTPTALRLLVAEELRLPPAEVAISVGDTDLCPWDIGTFGSRSMPDAGEHLRAAGAGLRHLLTERAARRFGVDPAEIELSSGRARAKGRDREVPVGYGDLVRGLRRIEVVPAAARPIPPSEWTVAGTSIPHGGGREIVTGAWRYTSDLHPPGMLYGRVLFPPAHGATLRRAEVARARALPGVTVVEAPGFVGVAAPDPARAAAALRAIRAEWSSEPGPSESEVVDYFRQHPIAAEDRWDVVHEEEGDVDRAWAEAPVALRAVYTTAFIAHVPLETHAALAVWEGDRVTIYLGSQTPFRARDDVARALGRPVEDVRIVVPPIGGGFGGKHASRLATAAARLARAADRPVRIVLSREEEFSQAYLRPMAVVEIRSGADGNGRLSVWESRTWNAGASAARPPYAVAHRRIGNQPTASPLSQGPYRALAATANNFARETHIDELAAATGADPLEFRRRHLADERLAAVLTAVADRAGWTPRTAGTARPGPPFRIGRGLAIGMEKGGRVASYSEVTVGDDRRLRIRRLVTGFEAGAIVHPANLKSQVEGGTIMALGGALFEAVHFAGGRVLNPRLSEYRVPRFQDIPPLEVILRDRPDLPSAGAGETPLIAVAPAIGNAIFDATGERIRSLPLTPDGYLPGPEEPTAGKPR